MPNSNHIAVLSVPNHLHCPELGFIAEYIFVNRMGFAQLQMQGTDTANYVLTCNQTFIEIPASGFFASLPLYAQGELPPALGLGKNLRLFPAENGGALDFDVFAAIFYLISRMEETVPQATFDAHGRYQKQASILYKYQALDWPVVDIWIAELRTVLRKNGLQLHENEQFEWWNTIDIDQVYAAKGKALLRRLGALAKKLVGAHFGEAMALAATLGGASDPFDNLPQMKAAGARNLVFLLCGGNSEYDLPKGRSATTLAQFVQKYQWQFELGLHPSYNSWQNHQILTKEREQLEELTGAPILHSRQHYLHFKWPQTADVLIQAGITHDFSMGYADAVAFRAGTSRPFPYYNFKLRQKTSLTIVPFALMDVGLKQYLKLNPEQAQAAILQTITRLKQVNGLFVSLWHNESLGTINGWKGWKQVYEYMKNEL
ncbi:hypothetical protein GC194_12900 [bacterium]|nr:hypothetical protein [bacterium]